MLRGSSHFSFHSDASWTAAWINPRNASSRHASGNASSRRAAALHGHVRPASGRSCSYCYAHGCYFLWFFPSSSGSSPGPSAYVMPHRLFVNVAIEWVPPWVQVRVRVLVGGWSDGSGLRTTLAGMFRAALSLAMIGVDGAKVGKTVLFSGRV